MTYCGKQTTLVGHSDCHRNMSALRRPIALRKALPALRSLPRQRYSTLAEVCISNAFINYADAPQDVRSDATFRIPIIDFSAFRATSALSEKRRVADDIVNGFKEVGFVYLSGHGIPSDVVDNVYKKVEPNEKFIREGIINHTSYRVRHSLVYPRKPR